MFLQAKLVMSTQCNCIYGNVTNKVRIDSDSSILLPASSVQTFTSVELIQNSVY